MLSCGRFRQVEEGKVRFVKTTEEVRRLQAIYAHPRFMTTRSLTVLFKAEPEAVRALVPPPLEPTPEAIGHAWVAETGNSNRMDPFLDAALYMRARYHDLVGDHCLTMPMSTDAAVTFGGELYGEPRKVAKINFDLHGGVPHTSGTVLCEVNPEAFLPCAFRKMDFMDIVAEGTLMHAQAARKTREGRGRRRQTE
jgi:hypothetical protein